MSELKDKLPILLVLNKKDLIKPGEIAKKLEVYFLSVDVGFRVFVFCGFKFHFIYFEYVSDF